MSEIERDNLEELSFYGFNLSNKIDKPKSITLKMIMEKNLAGKFESEEDKKGESRIAKKAEAVLKLTHVYLDREGIGEIDNLVEYLGDVSHIYLQHNLIKKIENLEFFKKLKFLILSNNQIRIVENLKCLSGLKLLDLSHNLIDEFDVSEFPASLSFLDMRGNECFSDEKCQKFNYSQQIKECLVNLCQLNGEDLCEDEGWPGEESVETGDESLEKLRDEIVERSKLRRKNDEINLDKIAQQRRLKLNEARQSINENLHIKIQPLNSANKTKRFY